MRCLFLDVTLINVLLHNVKFMVNPVVGFSIAMILYIVWCSRDQRPFSLKTMLLSTTLATINRHYLHCFHSEVMQMKTLVLMYIICAASNLWELCISFASVPDLCSTSWFHLARGLTMQHRTVLTNLFDSAGHISNYSLSCGPQV